LLLVVVVVPVLVGLAVTVLTALWLRLVQQRAVVVAVTILTLRGVLVAQAVVVGPSPALAEQERLCRGTLAGLVRLALRELVAVVAVLAVLVCRAWRYRLPGLAVSGASLILTEL
jgi:hypothetical protein